MLSIVNPVSKSAKSLVFRRSQAEAVLALARIRRRTEQRINELLAGEGLDVTAQQANAMMVLFQRREPMTARELADELAVTEVTVGRFVKALDNGGWVARTPDPTDGRAMLLRPTKKAYDALPRFIRVSNTMLDETFAGFTKQEVATLGAIINRVRDNLSC